MRDSRADPVPMHRLIERFPLQRGAHRTRDDGMCAMEMVAWLAGEPHSDEPRCTCPVLAAFVRACNDVMSDAERHRHLRPLVPVLVNTRASVAVERQRGFVVLDCLLRQLLPDLLRRQRRSAAAEALARLPAVVDATTLTLAAGALEDGAVDLRAARWVVQRAREGMAPARFVAGAVQVARVLGGESAWRAVAATIAVMAGLQRDAASDPVTPDARQG